MIWIFAILGLALVVAIALVVVGGETARLASRPRPAVFDIAEAVDRISEALSPAAQGRLSHDDVRWILLADADLLEGATADPNDAGYPWTRHRSEPAAADVDAGSDQEHTVDEDVAVARILEASESAGRDLEDVDIAEVLERRTDYLRAIGAIGGLVAEVDADDEEPDADAGPAAGTAGQGTDG